jgi:DNA-binding transcriptional MerR regulator
MPIEELARRTGMTVRNLRALQARDLLAPPELQGRKGFYTERHVARVALVQRLQGRGFSLAAIQALLKSWEAGSGLMDVMGLEDALTEQATPGPRTEVDVADAFPELLANATALSQALDQELVVRRGKRVVAPDAELLDIVKQQVAAGWPLESVLDEGRLLIADVERIAARFRKSFFTHVADRYLGPNAPASGLTEVAEKVALLRPLSVRAVTIILARAIERGGEPPQKKPPAPRRQSKRIKKGHR